MATENTPSDKKEVSGDSSHARKEGVSSNSIEELPASLRDAIESFYSSKDFKVRWQLFEHPSGDRRLIVNFNRRVDDAEWKDSAIDASNESSQDSLTNNSNFFKGKRKVRRKKKSTNSSGDSSESESCSEDVKETR